MIFNTVLHCPRNYLEKEMATQSIILAWRIPWKEQPGRLQSAVAAAKSLRSCPTLCDPIDSSPPGSPIPRILQARTLEWVAISFSNAWKRKVEGKSLNHAQLFARNAAAAAKSLQSCPTLCDPRDGSPPDSPVPGILKARILEWVAKGINEGKKKIFYFSYS